MFNTVITKEKTMFDTIVMFDTVERLILFNMGVWKNFEITPCPEKLATALMHSEKSAKEGLNNLFRLGCLYKIGESYQLTYIGKRMAKKLEEKLKENRKYSIQEKFKLDEILGGIWIESLFPKGFLQ